MFFLKLRKFCRALTLIVALVAFTAIAPNSRAEGLDHIPESVRQMTGDLISIYSVDEDKQVNAFREWLAKYRPTLVTSSLAHANDFFERAMDEEWRNITPKQQNGIKEVIKAIAGDEEVRSLISRLPFENLPAVSDDRIKKFLGVGKAQMESISISDQPGFKRILDPKDGLRIKDERLRALANEVLPKFFDALPNRIKSRIIAAVLKLPAGATSAEQASAVLQNSGPLVQKLFQLIGRETDSPELKEVMAKLQSDIQPIAREKIIETIVKRFGKDVVGTKFGEISAPIASGSVGQVHFSTIRATGQEVAIKVRRPGVMEDFLAEAEALRKVTKGTEFEGVADKIIRNIGMEMDFRIEAANLKEGEQYINKKRGIDIAKAIDGFEPQEDVLVIQKAKGKKSSFYKNLPELLKRGEAVQNVLEDWMRKSIFRGGFFHGDLHPGNVYLQIPAATPVGYLAELIDFGNAARITAKERKAFIQLLSATTLRAPDEVLVAIEQLSPIPEKNRAAYTAHIKQVLESKPTKPLAKWFQGVIGEILAGGLKYGVEFPDAFLSFQRGKTFLELELADVNKRLDELDPEKKLGRFDPMRAEMKAMVKEAPAAVKNIALGRETDSPLTVEMMRNIFRAWKNSPYRGNIRALCADFFRNIGHANPLND
jgi:predicted unusual protein kinase regulating ubiquinone biosynthesis (AarF/ABC1/UbiB family)